MKKESVERIISEILEDEEYWIITTNIPQGRGINGVDYLEFTSCIHSNRNNDSVTSHVVSFGDDYLRLNVTYRHHSGSFDTSVMYLPYENITSIISQRGKEYNYHSLGML